MQEVSHTHAFDREAGRKEVVRITILLSVITLIELALGFWLMKVETPVYRHILKGLICIFMLSKAFYIVGYFMHLKHELRNLIMTIVVPILLFIWIIIAFLADGNSYKNLKSRYDSYYHEKSQIKVEKPAHGEQDPGAAKKGTIE